MLGVKSLLISRAFIKKFDQTTTRQSSPLNWKSETHSYNLFICLTAREPGSQTCPHQGWKPSHVSTAQVQAQHQAPCVRREAIYILYRMLGLHG